MRYRLLATYQGAPYEAGIGPDETGVVLFAACPPPEDLRFEPATGHWRKRVGRSEVQALYESRPVGMFRGERCVVLDDLTDRLHIAYLGHDAYRAAELGYWEVDRGVFELISPRHEVTDIVEQRMPIAPQGRPPGYAPALANGSRPDLPDLSPLGPLPGSEGRRSVPAADESPLPLEAQALRAATAAARKSSKNQPGQAGPDVRDQPRAGPVAAARALAHRPVPDVPAGLSEPSSAPSHAADAVGGVPSWTPQAHEADTALTAVPPPRAVSSGPADRSAADTDSAPMYGVPMGATPVGASEATAEVGSGRAARRRRATRRRLPTQRIFSELAAQAGIPPGAYAIDQDVDGAMCLVRTDDGFEVFNSLAGARHEVRIFEDEESAYFYLFGVLVAEALRNGLLVATQDSGLQVR
jgi:hypothetical protein